jgi:methyl-accepting chemotaxis protein
MNKSKNKRKWRNFLIRYDIQLRIAIYNLIFQFFVISVVIMTTLLPLYNGFQNSNNLSAQHFSAKLFIDISERLFLAFIGIVVAGFIYNVLLSHRFCGPLVNFNKTFNKMAQGNLACKIYLRRSDFLKCEADQINDMMDALSLHLNDLKQHHRLLQKKLENIINSDSKLDGSEQPLSEIKKLVDAYEKKLDFFSTSELSLMSERKDFRTCPTTSILRNQV